MKSPWKGSPRTHPFIGHSVGGHLPSTLGAGDTEPTVGQPPGSCGTGWPSAFPMHVLRTTCSPGGSQDFSPGHLHTECPAGQVPFTSALPLRSAKNQRTHFLKNTLLLSSKRSYGELTDCTRQVADQLDCFWPNAAVDQFFVAIHRHYFKNCPASGRAVRDPPRSILCPFIVVPILVTLLVTALVVWRSKRPEGIV
ncbi:receptor activity-modifying protein 1 isoform X2 [Mirounga leonina]|uniref:receptor activity-modifying protein 1 isoform X2 n=1 Tax=Mirounga leonina TaxID=9715 RepID=UPI00156C3332|nr:receptor activity-modifying protein 1 isoform X2 [Mirounga leonina]